MKIGILPLGRPTFDVAFAAEKLDLMLQRLDETGHEICGPRDLLFNEAATRYAMEDLRCEATDQVLLLQVTFTDAAMTALASEVFDQPLLIWAVGEPRVGGRLRLNAFCGLNLASHALSLRGRQFSWLYSDPDGEVASDLDDLFSSRCLSGRLDAMSPDGFETPDGKQIADTLMRRKIARIGDHPPGFDTCAYSPETVAALTGIHVDALDLEDLFASGRAADDDALADAFGIARSDLDGLDQVDQEQLQRSLRLKAGLDEIRDRGSYDAFALRCWPETFTEYGGAVCGPAAMMGENKVPCACEADVFGAVTQLMLQEVSGAPVFLTDLVDVDTADNTGVVWHCGQAPISMCSSGRKPVATIHTNRRMPLLYEFPLKPGPVTLLRISQAYNKPKMVLAYGEMLDRPMAFTGTSGVLRFERNADLVLSDIIASGLEHHMAIAYGDHRPVLRSTAAAMGLPLLEL